MLPAGEISEAPVAPVRWPWAPGRGHCWPSEEAQASRGARLSEVEVAAWGRGCRDPGEMALAAPVRWQTSRRRWPQCGGSGDPWRGAPGGRAG